MSNIREEINLRMIYFSFFFLLKLLHLPAMPITATLLEIPYCIQRTTYNQQNINAIGPNSEIKRRKYTNYQSYFFLVPYSIAISCFHPESIITIPQIGISYHRTLADRQPLLIKAIQFTHDPIHSWCLEI